MSDTYYIIASLAAVGCLICLLLWIHDTRLRRYWNKAMYGKAEPPWPQPFSFFVDMWNEWIACWRRLSPADRWEWLMFVVLLVVLLAFMAAKILAVVYASSTL